MTMNNVKYKENEIQSEIVAFRGETKKVLVYPLTYIENKLTKIDVI